MQLISLDITRIYIGRILEFLRHLCLIEPGKNCSLKLRYYKTDLVPCLTIKNIKYNVYICFAPNEIPKDHISINLNAHV